MKDKILELLGTGLQENVVASAVGCTPGYISQLLAQPEFRSAVLERRVLALQQHTARDSRYDTLEDKLLDRLEQVVPFTTRIGEITRALQVVNTAKRRGAPHTEQAELEAVKSVVLNMPVQVIQHFQLNENKEVISVEGRPMVSATLAQAAQLAGSLRSPAPQNQVSPQVSVQKSVHESKENEQAA